MHMVEKVRGSAGFKAKPKPIIFTEDDGLCDHDGMMSWDRAEPIMRDPTKTGPQGVACFFHFDKCKPEAATKCAFGQAVAARASWGIFLGCCGFSTCPSGAHKYDRCLCPTPLSLTSPVLSPLYHSPTILLSSLLPSPLPSLLPPPLSSLLPSPLAHRSGMGFQCPPMLH